MRAITDAQEAVYGLTTNQRATWVKVEVYSELTSTWVELTNYLNRNWIKSVELSESIDEVIQTATIEVYVLGGQQGETSSSPFINSGLFSFPNGYTAYKQLLNIYKKVRVSLAVTPIDVPPSSSDWMLKFRGYIDNVSLTKFGLTLVCKDEMGYLADTWITTQKYYGATDGSVLLEDVINDITTTWVAGILGSSATLWSRNGTGGTPFNPADSPGWALYPDLLQSMSVMDAITRLADQIGFDIRFFWQTNAADFRLVLQEPMRALSSSLRTFTQAEILDAKLDLGLRDIRNHIVVKYTNTAKVRLDSTPSVDSSSVTNYGLRVLQISEDQTSQINTSTEANALADNILSDLSSPITVGTFTLPLFPNVELMDYYTFTGDDILWSTYALGVKAITHRIDSAGGHTTIVASGLSSAKTNWQKYQQAPNYSKSGSTYRIITSTMTGNLIPNGDLGEWTRF